MKADFATEDIIEESRNLFYSSSSLIRNYTTAVETKSWRNHLLTKSIDRGFITCDSKRYITIEECLKIYPTKFMLSDWLSKIEECLEKHGKVFLSPPQAVNNMEIFYTDLDIAIEIPPEDILPLEIINKHPIICITKTFMENQTFYVLNKIRVYKWTKGKSPDLYLKQLSC